MVSAHTFKTVTNTKRKIAISIPLFPHLLEANLQLF